MLTTTQLAAHLGVSERTVARMVLDGCPAMLVGQRRRFDLAAVTQWTKERAQCQQEKMPKDGGTSKFASAESALIAASARMRLRVMPGV